MIINVPSSRSSGFIKSNTEPSGTFIDGTVWYNPTKEEFKYYVAGKGFRSGSTEVSFSRYESLYTMPNTITTPTNIANIPIGIDGFNVNDILEVMYEGLTLSNTQYTVNYKTNSITLLDFTTIAGENVLFTVIRIHEATDITSIIPELTAHTVRKATDTIEGHVILSNSTTENNYINGLAATPKAVYDSQLLTDTVTEKKYKFGVTNGLLYIKEVEE